MYKVLIIDDEVIIRKGLRNIIDWKDLDCEICGEASDGMEGIELINKFKPDILITDIKMPEIDGLTMIKNVKEKISNCKIIILTGYRDFEYLQEAIRIGAFDYILKPSKIENITQILNKAKISLDKEREKEDDLNKLKEYFDEKIPVLKQKFLYDVIYNLNNNREDILEEYKMYDLNIKDFLVVVAERDEDSNITDSYKKQLYKFAITNTMEDLFKEKFSIENIPTDKNRIIFIIQSKEKNNINDIYLNINKLQDIVKNGFNFTVTTGVSTMGEDLFSLSEKAKEAISALEYKFYLGNNSIILYEDIKALYKGNDYLELDQYQKILIQYIKSGNENNMKNTVADIFDFVNENKLDEKTVKSYYLSMINMINNIFYFETKSNVNIVDDNFSIYNTVDNCNNIKELNVLLQDIALNSVNKITKINEKTINSTLQNAIEYINENYHKQISLGEVAEHCFVSSYYLSRMFKRVINKNFVDYLNEVRIEKAKVYLKENKYKAYEIAEMVGINDPHYFSKLFKKYTNITPSEYKEMELAD